MPRQITDGSGVEWQVSLSGRRTQYTKDEVSLVFSPAGGEASLRRYARFSPSGAKSAERAYEEASDKMLKSLLATSQPAWTSPAGDYIGRG